MKNESLKKKREIKRTSLFNAVRRKTILKVFGLTFSLILAGISSILIWEIFIEGNILNGNYNENPIDNPDSINDNDAIHIAIGGNDNYPGTREFPVKTITRGLYLAELLNKKYVAISKGIYNLSDTLELIDGISLYGGYDSSSLWQWSKNNKVIFQVNHTIAVLANNINTETVLNSLYIRGNNASKYGESTYGVMCNNSDMLKLINCTIGAGVPMEGVNGTSYEGNPASKGPNGSFGDPGVEDGGPFCSEAPQPQGGSGGVAFHGNDGGDGGDAGRDDNYGFNGSPGSGGAFGGQGTPHGQGDWNPTLQYCGDNGTDGNNGNNGTNGSIGTFLPSGFVISNGTKGENGEPGHGGGGGGGGGGGTLDCNSYGGGGGGGASIALYLWNSDIEVNKCILIAKKGGSGGNGGLGQKGGSGGIGGWGGNPSKLNAGNPYGGAADQDDASNGGRGGNGGKGGNGGHGGAGSGGHSIGILKGGTSAPSLKNIVYDINLAGKGGFSPLGVGLEGFSSNIYIA